AALAESVSMAFMVLLDTLSPEERAAFLLREIFEYDSAEIGKMLNTSAVNARQLVHRAKARLGKRRPHARAATGDAIRKRNIVQRLGTALRTNDAEGLPHLLSEDASLWREGGGRVTAARRSLAGRTEVITMLLGVRRTSRAAGTTVDAALNLDVLDV